MSACPLKVRICHAEPIVNAGLTALLGSCRQLAVIADEPDVIITDYDDGLKRARLGKHKVMIVTTRARDWNVRSALSSGVAAYLPQHCAAAELGEALAALGAGQCYYQKPLLARLADTLRWLDFTPREAQVLDLMAEGCCNKLIARQLDIEVGTVKTHIKSLFAKLGATHRTQAVVMAIQRGIVCQ
ncbi:DNA-binding response regulator [Pseudoduganella sp. FT55W]|uniref:DNA-binding response regulator n=1 Tax=Duganella rivi TaxID=2666083 RepID=A0A7X4GRL6_9BURK|nr:response regulator transcription factor [Duganella rivi]MYM67910.1 DNA-binding response regulator [Duganella rivi]